jgi:hypothetical protein
MSLERDKAPLQLLVGVSEGSGAATFIVGSSRAEVKGWGHDYAPEETTEKKDKTKGREQ